MPDFAVILPAGGRAVRFGGSRNKLLRELHGVTLLRRSVGAFAIRKDVRQIVVATSDPLMIGELAEMNDARVTTCPGGASRAESVKNGLLFVRGDGAIYPEKQVQWVAVHDAARPLIAQGLIDATLDAAVEYGAAAPALPVALTIKEARGPLPAKVERTVPRQNLWAMQTPQIVRVSDLAEAFEKCPVPLDEVTDDVQLLELAGKSVWLVEGDERNLKITTQLDLRLAEMMSSC
jgi:2-C-methyl-D-erythritol 4-phosphate cytidylyltransferase